MRVDRYTELDRSEWNGFVRASRNGTFLFEREYMEYHRERFQDFSLIVRDNRGKIAALLPAHRDAETVASHAGLTYGGFVTGEAMKQPLMLRVFDVVLTFLLDAGVRHLLYKPVPHIYHRAPAEEDRYALFLLGARCIRCGALVAVDRRHPLDYQERRRRGIKKASAAGLLASRSDDLRNYWRLLESVLASVHGAHPVHSVDEIANLAVRFPNNIQLYTCLRGCEMLGGVLVYESATVARAQYIASTSEGKALGALDLLFDYLLTSVYAHKDYFEFGTSDEQGGHRLNEGLIDQKEGFGARAVTLEEYDIDLTCWRAGALAQVLE